MSIKFSNPFSIKYPLSISKSHIDGMGAYAIKNIPARKKIGDLGGKIITIEEAEKRIKKVKRIALVELTDKHALDASVNSNELRYVNHCCCPNTYMRVLKNRVEFYALLPIKKGEELTCDYGETHHKGKLPCRCGAKNCRGFI